MNEPRRPNSFDLSGDYGVEIVYETTSITGQARFTFRDGNRDVSASGDEIEAEQTSLGTLVTIRLEEVADLHVITVSLLVPTVNLDDREAQIETVAVETTRRTSIGGPGTVTGPLQTYRAHAVHGTARLVDF